MFPNFYVTLRTVVALDLIALGLVSSTLGCAPELNVSMNGSVGGRDASPAADGFYYAAMDDEGRTRVNVVSTDVANACSVFSEQLEARADAFMERNSVIEEYGATSEEGYAAQKKLGKTLIQIDADLLPPTYFQTRIGVVIEGNEDAEHRYVVGDGASVAHCYEGVADVYAGIPYLKDQCHVASQGLIDLVHQPDAYVGLSGEGRFTDEDGSGAVDKLAFELSVPHCAEVESAVARLASLRQ